MKQILEKLKVDTVVITGLVTHGCVQAACYGAKKNGLEVILIGDGHSSYHKDAPELIKEWNDKISQDGMKVMTVEGFCYI